MSFDLSKADVTPDTLPAELKQLAPIEAAAMEVLLRGGSITAAARAADVSRQTIYDWLAPESRFAQIYHTWKRNMADTARTRLLMLAESATNVVAASISRGDTKTSLKILTGMGVLSSPPLGPPISQHHADKAEADAKISQRDAVKIEDPPEDRTYTPWREPIRYNPPQ